MGFGADGSIGSRLQRDHPGIDMAQRVRIEAEAVGNTGPEIVEDDVCVLAEHRDDGTPRLRFGVDANTSLAVIGTDDGPFTAQRGSAGRRLDLNDVRSIIGQQLGRVRSRHEHSEVDDANARQRRRRCVTDPRRARGRGRRIRKSQWIADGAPARFVLLDDPIEAGLVVAPTVARRQHDLRRNPRFAQPSDQIARDGAGRRSSTGRNCHRSSAGPRAASGMPRSRGSTESSIPRVR